MRMAVAALAITMAASSATAGCSLRHDAPASHGDNPSATGRLGDTLTLNRVDGGVVEVTLDRIVTPVHVVGDQADPTLNYLAAQLTITDIGEIEAEASVLVNVTLTGSDGMTYQADLNDVTECDNFDDGMFRLQPGESTTGCVVFAVPDGVTAAGVDYAPSAGFADDRGRWVVS